MSSPETDSVRRHLIAVLSAQGTALCLDHRRVARLFEAEFPRRPWPAVAIHWAVKEGVAADLMSIQGSVSSMVFERLSMRLMDRTGLARGSATWAVQAWAEGLGLSVEEVAPRLQGAPIQTRFNPHMADRPRGAPWNLRGHRKAITGVTFNSDGSLMATSSVDRTVRLWDTRAGEAARVLMGGHRDWVRGVSFRPDGKQLASVGDDGAVRLWDPQSGERMFRLVGHDTGAQCLCWSPDSRLVVSGGTDGQVCLWEVASLQRLAVLGPFGGGISQLAFDMQGRWLAVARPDAVEIWDLEAVKQIQQIEVAGRRAVVAASPKDVLFIGDERGAMAWNVSANRMLRTFNGHDGAVRAIAAHPNGLGLVTGGEDQTVRLWHAADAWEAQCFAIRDAHVTALAFHPAGHIGIGCSDGHAQFREMERGGML